MHVAMAAALDEAIEQIRTIRLVARTEGLATRPRWPVIILESPKGLDGTEVCRWCRERKHVPLSPGTAVRVSP